MPRNSPGKVRAKQAAPHVVTKKKRKLAPQALSDAKAREMLDRGDAKVTAAFNRATRV